VDIYFEYRRDCEGLHLNEMFRDPLSKEKSQALGQKVGDICFLIDLGKGLSYLIKAPR